MASRTVRPVRRIALAALALGLAAALSGCVSEVLDPPGDAEPTLSPTTAPEPTPTITPTAGADVLDIDCADLVDPDAVYALNPTLALLGATDGDPGSAAGEALAAGGVACRWVLESGAADVVVSVARLAEGDLATKRENAGEDVTGSDPEAYFATTDDVGTLTAFSGPYWIVITSPLIAIPEDGAGVLESIVAALPTA